MFKKILVATDGSENAHQAVDLAADIAVKYDAELIVMNVRKPGRIPEEMELAAELLGIPERPGSENMVCDDGRFPVKPAPDGLLHLAERLPDRPLYYFGDNRDDLTALLSARERSGNDDLHFVCCLTAASDRDSVDWFATAGAGMIAVGVEEALRTLLPSP